MDTGRRPTVDAGSNAAPSYATSVNGFTSKRLHRRDEQGNRFPLQSETIPISQSEYIVKNQKANRNEMTGPGFRRFRFLQEHSIQLLFLSSVPETSKGGPSVPAGIQFSLSGKYSSRRWAMIRRRPEAASAPAPGTRPACPESPRFAAAIRSAGPQSAPCIAPSIAEFRPRTFADIVTRDSRRGHRDLLARSRFFTDWQIRNCPQYAGRKEYKTDEKGNADQRIATGRMPDCDTRRWRSGRTLR